MIYLDDVPIAVDLELARQAAGGRRLLRTSTESLEVVLADGAKFSVLVRQIPWNLTSIRAVLVCPRCDRDVLTLRRADDGLACKQCLMERGLRYRSQRRRQCQSAPSAAHPGNELVEEVTP